MIYLMAARRALAPLNLGAPPPSHDTCGGEFFPQQAAPRKGINEEARAGVVSHLTVHRGGPAQRLTSRECDPAFWNRIAATYPLSSPWGTSTLTPAQTRTA